MSIKRLNCDSYREIIQIYEQEEKYMPFGDRRRSFGGPREMHKAVCSSCGKETEVPFKPTEGRPVYCKDCYMKQKPSRE